MMYEYIKDFRYFEPKDLNIFGDYGCIDCGHIQKQKSKFCAECGSSNVIPYRTNSICHDCKISFIGKYCPDCGKGEHYKFKKENELIPTNSIIIGKIISKIILIMGVFGCILTVILANS